MEEFLITGKEINYIREIIEMRKRLMVLKRYYEQLSDIAEDICENENELIREKTMKFFRIFQSRVERLYQEVLNLRDYITQVREAYQAQVDINLNNIMKLFTVITAIFLPLTLIVGWYGMNLQMPEYGWRFGYPVIIGISAAVVAGVYLILKGHRTIVASPDGRLAVNTTGNSGMAKGGSGDILSGMVVSLLGQGMEPFDACCAAVYCHGRAGDMAAAELGERGMSPADLLSRLPYAFKETEQG